MRIIRTLHNEDVSFDYYVFYFLIFAGFITPEYFIDSIPGLNIALSVISVATMMLYYLIKLRGIKINFTFLLITNAYLIWIFIATFLYNKSDLIQYIFQIWKVIFICVVVDCISEENTTIINSALFFIRDYTALFFIIDIIASVISRETSIYGNVNSIIKYLIPGIVCSLIIDNKRKRISFFTILYFGGVIFQFVTVYHAMTSLITIVFFAIWMLFKKKWEKKASIIYLIIIIIEIVIEFGLINFALNQSSWFSNVSMTLGKDALASGRYWIWRRALFLIKDSPIVGYGFIKSDSLKSLILNSYGAHNYYFDIMINGGIIALLLFMIELVLPIIIVNNKILNNEQYIFLGGWVSITIQFLTEPLRGWEYMFIPILFAFLISIRAKYSEN